MNKKEICIVIPIYKETLNDFEVQSVEQCVKVLSDYTIFFVCPKGLNVNFYIENFSEISNFTYFDNFYFDDIKGYNKLMLNPEFYKSFISFEYMLVYQTDCYVFRDELMYWANKGYDYIGGVWFDDYTGNPRQGANIWHAGNGGFSLRKIDKLIKILSTPYTSLKSLKQLAEENKLNLAFGRKAFLKGLFKIPFKFLKRKNNLKYYVTKFKEGEDMLFMELNLKYNKIHVPPISDVLGFAWDREPSFLYDKQGQLPFGCHAWYRDDFPYERNKEFWLKHMNSNLK
ncbi:DUF5672 family protein [Flavobacterium sp.]|jgi:hypothetical protein|uniref:DUF5672 family protein n=1 Tax=Flavobacterium sp. TaxID=239 RepID=UPI0037C0FB99